MKDDSKPLSQHLYFGFSACIFAPGMTTRSYHPPTTPAQPPGLLRLLRAARLQAGVDKLLLPTNRRLFNARQRQLP